MSEETRRKWRKKLIKNLLVYLLADLIMISVVFYMYKIEWELIPTLILIFLILVNLNIPMTYREKFNCGRNYILLKVFSF